MTNSDVVPFDIRSEGERQFSESFLALKNEVARKSLEGDVIIGDTALPVQEHPKPEVGKALFALLQTIPGIALTPDATDRIRTARLATIRSREVSTPLLVRKNASTKVSVRWDMEPTVTFTKLVNGSGVKMDLRYRENGVFAGGSLSDYYSEQYVRQRVSFNEIGRITNHPKELSYRLGKTQAVNVTKLVHDLTTSSKYIERNLSVYSFI